METQATSLNILERFNRWVQESIMVKLFSIGFLILILLIPAHWVQELIDERQARADDVLREVAGKWSGAQTVSGPILVIPYRKQEVIEVEKRKEIRETVDNAYFLPSTLNVAGKMNPEILNRGIFDAIVYKSDIEVRSAFDTPDFKSLKIADNQVLWDQAYLIFGIADLRGISENPVFSVGGEQMATEPSNNIGVNTYGTVEKSAARRASYEDGEVYTDRADASSPSHGIVAKLNWKDAASFVNDVNIHLHLKGSSRLDFVPSGKTTAVKLTSPWTNPSFDGEFLPATRDVSTAGFNAEWKVLHYNRPFSQQWVGNDNSLTGANFGVKLLLPVDQYQKSMRTSKYGALVVLLTFVALFLIEITQKVRIHPFQYILIGAALIIYYTLLLSFAEHMGYNVAYGIATALTVVMVTLYSTTFLHPRKLSALFALVLSITYTFIFVIIQEQDYSLLLGSLGLFVIIGVLMYFSRKVSWYRATA